MRIPRVLLSGTLAVAAVAAAWTGLSRAAPLQPPSPPAHTRPPSIPGQRFQPAPAPPPQLGVDIDFYAYPGMDIGALALADVGYVKSLHANSVSVSFPFFVAGRRSSVVHATDATPTPAALAQFALDAEQAGLYVSIRPLLDEHNLGHSRVRWSPPLLSEWFASYRRFLLPYARMAQSVHIPELFIGAELSKFENSPHWASLAAAIRRVYHGRLAYAHNTGQKTDLVFATAGVQQTFDAYPRFPHLSASANQAQLNANWASFGRLLPAQTILSEVGIASQASGYTAPYKWRWRHEPLLPEIQARWFTAACHAVAADHLGGLYFWSLTFGQPLHAAPTKADPASFVAAPGARAIAACFQRLGRGSR